VHLGIYYASSSDAEPQCGEKKNGTSFGHAVFCFEADPMSDPLIITNLSKIIYHNITPSADYDAITPETIARNFFGGTVFEKLGAGD
jgi:hypothetical protein